MPWTSTAPSFADLELFVAVLDTGSLSRAATVQGISQPAASARLRGLERRLGVQLLDRTTAGSTPTAAGLGVAELATDVLTAMSRLLDGVGALHADAEQLRVIASYTTAEHLLPRWLSEFHRAHPDVGTELRVANSTVVEREVRDGHADLGFVEGPQRITELQTLDVARDELIVVVAPDHPWNRRRSPVTMRTLAATPLVVRETGSGTRETLDLVLGQHGLTAVPPALELGSTVAVKSAVIAGVGPAVLSRLAVEGELATGRLVVVDLEGLAIERTLRAVWSKATVPSAGALALLHQLGLPSPGRRTRRPGGDRRVQ
jgi:DNA-binding transcriptional LysR family regulator